ncbi:MAG: nucleoside deaminase [Ketobacteraceae bacterium]|nr:nucleoside deaminase [Ketobacteraceae bacterium]
MPAPPLSFFPQPLAVQFPEWLEKVVKPGDIYATETARMELAVHLSDLQVQHRTGGPFGAAVFNLETGAVVGVGVNRVVPDNASIAHAEVVAWSCAQRYLATYDLASTALPELGLYSSSQPCVACWGGLFWTGLSKLVCGATKADVEQLAGFDEGPVPADWDRLLEDAGIAVIKELCRGEAREVLRRYGASGVIYNPSH